MWNSPIVWILMLLVLTDIALLFIYVIKKNKAALYACLAIFVILTVITMWITSEGTQTLF